MLSMQETAEQTETSLPWLIFHVRESCFAVDSGKVSTILQMPETICPVPEASPFVRGIFDLRGMVLPLLDLRLIFGLPSVEEEYREFVEMLEARKNDHIHWVKELERSVKEDQRFELATDPHKCAFGRWYDQYHSEIDSVNLMMHRIDSPHRKLHEAALTVEKCRQEGDAGEREGCMEAALKQAKKQYMPAVLKLLEEAKEVFRTNYREMVIVLEDGDARQGLIVDDVLAVDWLEPMDAEEMSQVYETNYITGMATCKSVTGNILLLDEDKLLHIF